MKAFFLWYLYRPLFGILGFVLGFHPRVRERRNFERRNLSDPLSVSFLKDQSSAQVCFEFSSEGEYQQVAPLIDDSLREGKSVELVFFSPSVEKTIMELGARHPERVRYLRYPFLTISREHSFTSWVSARRMVMVRYDLFPEFLLWALEPGHKLALVWMTFKKERLKGSSVSPLKKLFLKAASRIVYASTEDEKAGSSLGFPGPAFDFRREQIERRIGLRSQKFELKFPLYPELRSCLSSVPEDRRIILGNTWPSDNFLLKEIPHDYFVLIVPHNLTPDVLGRTFEALKEMGRTPVEINDKLRALPAGNTFILNQKGLLCELYADFPRSYVGGGFETSVHSLLEPLGGGSLFISCGPVHHRSTEYDVVAAEGKMTEVKTAEDFRRWVRLPLNRERTTPGKSGVDYESLKKDVLAC